MKTILAATDFSEASESVVEYAANLASLTGADLHIIHAFHRVPSTELDLLERDLFLVHQADHKSHLQEIVVGLEEKFNINVKGSVKIGLAGEEIERLAQTVKADLVVMGLRRLNKLEEVLFGSVTTYMMKNSNFPLLAIPQNFIFSKINEITFAYDFKYIPDHTFQILEDLSKALTTRIRVLHIFKKHAVYAADKVVAGMILENQLKDIDHTYLMEQNKDIEEGMGEYLKSAKNILFAMVHHEKSWLKEIFTKSYTENIAFQIAVPMLVFPNKFETEL